MEAIKADTLDRMFDTAMACYDGPCGEWHVYEHLKREVVQQLPIPEQEQAIQRLKQYLEI